MGATRLPLGLVLAAMCTPALANPLSDAAKRLQQAEKARAAMETYQQQVGRALQAAQAGESVLADQRVKAAQALRSTEDAVVAAGARLQAAQQTQDQAEAALRQHAAAFSALVPLMLRMSRYPAETVLAIPAPPDRAVEGLLLTRALATSLNREASALREAERKAAQSRALTAQEAAALGARRLTQQAQAAALEKDVDAAQAKVSAAEAEGQAAAQRVAALAAQAQTLRDAIAEMDAAQKKAAEKAAQEAARASRNKQPEAARIAMATEAALTRPTLTLKAGRMLAPVAGQVVRRFGQDENGEPATGLTYGAAPGAFVASPCAGRVGFAAPFRSYGKLVIVECAGGYDWVLAGLEKISAQPGSELRAGEPIGRMPDFNPGTTSASGSRPGLYVELRSHGEPIDPLPFLNAKG